LQASPIKLKKPPQTETQQLSCSVWVIAATLVQGIESDGCGCAFLPLYREKAVAVQQIFSFDSWLFSG